MLLTSLAVSFDIFGKAASTAPVRYVSTVLKNLCSDIDLFKTRFIDAKHGLAIASKMVEKLQKAQ